MIASRPPPAIFLTTPSVMFAFSKSSQRKGPLPTVSWGALGSCSAVVGPLGTLGFFVVAVVAVVAVVGTVLVAVVAVVPDVVVAAVVVDVVLVSPQAASIQTTITATRTKDITLFIV
jgi:hypothetical protein